MTYKVGVMVGSLSKDSINRKLSRALAKLAPKSLNLVEISIGDLPLYNRDFDLDYPPVAKAFKSAVADVHSLIFVTPEYNRSIPGVLKNAIDWGSRPSGKNAFDKKPSGIIGTSGGAIGTALAQQHLRSVLSYLNCPHLSQPEAYIQFKDGLITAEGEVTNPSTAEFLRKWLSAYDEFVAKILGNSERP
jgi:chromate reductase, NAD(P)H dehydrogenase (quinone)